MCFLAYFDVLLSFNLTIYDASIPYKAQVNQGDCPTNLVEVSTNVTSLRTYLWGKFFASTDNFEVAVCTFAWVQFLFCPGPFIIPRMRDPQGSPWATTVEGPLCLGRGEGGAERRGGPLRSPWGGASPCKK